MLFRSYVKNGEIVLNLSYDATHKLTISAEAVQFAARFAGVSRECHVPMSAVTGIFARENSQGLFFQPDPEPAGAAGETASAAKAATTEPPPPTPPTTPTRPKLQVVK